MTEVDSTATSESDEQTDGAYLCNWNTCYEHNPEADRAPLPQSTPYRVGRLGSHIIHNLSAQ